MYFSSEPAMWNLAGKLNDKLQCCLGRICTLVLSGLPTYVDFVERCVEEEEALFYSVVHL